MITCRLPEKDTSSISIRANGTIARGRRWSPHSAADGWTELDRGRDQSVKRFVYNERLTGAELFLNGTSLGSKTMDGHGARISRWSVHFATGKLQAKGRPKGGSVVADPQRFEGRRGVGGGGTKLEGLRPPRSPRQSVDSPLTEARLGLRGSGRDPTRRASSFPKANKHDCRRTVERSGNPRGARTRAIRPKHDSITRARSTPLQRPKRDMAPSFSPPRAAGTATRGRDLGGAVGHAA